MSIWKPWLVNKRQISEWWGPDGFTTTIYDMDVRQGGVWRFVMHGPDGVDYPNRVVYKEVETSERLVYAHGSDEDSDPDFHVTVSFEEVGDQTRLTMQMMFPTAEARDKTVEFGAVEGGNQTLNRLENHLSDRIT